MNLQCQNSVISPSNDSGIITQLFLCTKDIEKWLRDLLNDVLTDDAVPGCGLSNLIIRLND